LGKHEGYPFYTVGQRKGLGIALGEPMFVTEIRPDTNTVVLGRESDLVRNGMMVGKVNLMKYSELPTEGLEAVTKVRYRDAGALSTVLPIGNDVEVQFHANVKGVAPGQSAVFYEGDDVVGGGIIQGSFN
jgi:tRNA-specific 2-thiouridylase